MVLEIILVVLKWFRWFENSSGGFKNGSGGSRIMVLGVLKTVRVV